MSGSWRHITLGDIFEISSSKRVLQKQWVKEGIPFYRAREIVKLSKHGTVENDLFITNELYEEYKAKFGVPESGDLMVSAVGTLGACYTVKPQDRFYFKDASVLQFRPKEELSSMFIEYAFQTQEIVKQINSGSGSTVGTFTISRAKTTRISLPPLAEQKRIAAILDKADALRQKRRDAIAQCDEFLKATFLDMFGDPVTNPKGWEVKFMKDLIDPNRPITYGILKPGEDFEGGIPYIKVMDMKEGKILFQQLKRTTPEIASQYKRSILKKGDLLISIRGHVGRLARVSERAAGANITQDTARLAVIGENPIFVEYSLATIEMQRFMQRFVKGAAVKGINLGDLKVLPTITPPLDFQDKFAEIAKKTEAMKEKMQQSLQEIDDNFNALMQSAFKGDV